MTGVGSTIGAGSAIVARCVANFCGAGTSGLATYGVGTSSSLVGTVNILFVCLIEESAGALAVGIGSLLLFSSSLIAASIP